MACLMLAEDGIISAANETSLRWLEHSSDQVLGKPLHAFFGAGGQFFLQSQVFPMLTLKGGLEEIYLRVKTSKGTQIPILANIGRLTVAGRTVIEFSFIRIAQRGHLEDELLLAKKLAEQASDSKTKFLGMMSHELRTPLGAISLNNQLLLSGEFGQIPLAQQELIEGSEGCVRSVTVLIEDILNFAQMRGGPIQIVPKNLSVEIALDRAILAIRHRFQVAELTLRKDAGGAELVARYDPDRVQQILLNLLNNALKFTPKGGAVSISAFREGEWAVVEITDTGCGIPHDQLSRIFEPFVQLHSSVETTEKKGVGLGLAICSDLAIAMGGQMRVRSEAGKGSTFTMVLPLAS